MGGNNEELKVKSTDKAYFKDEKNLLDLLKWSALYRIAKCLLLFADKKYKDYSLWEKFYQKF